MAQKLIHDRYKIIKKIGGGGFGEVFLAQDIELDMRVALKRFNPKKFSELVQNDKMAEKYSLLSEIKKGILLDHPNILRYFYAFKTQEQSDWGTLEYEVGIMDYMEDGDLNQFLSKNPTEEQIITVFEKILRGIVYLHEKKIIHRDLKPANILMKGNEPQIMDFGISKDLENADVSVSLLLGTVEFMAPEQFFPNKFGVKGKITEKLDIWAFGIMLYTALTGTLPFGERKLGDTADEIREKITENDFEPDFEKLPVKYRPIINSALSRYSIDRPTSSELLEQFRSSEKIIVEKPIVKEEPVEEVLTVDDKPIVEKRKEEPLNSSIEMAPELTSAGSNRTNLMWYVFFSLLCGLGGYYLYQQFGQPKDWGEKKEAFINDFDKQLNRSKTIKGKIALFSGLKKDPTYIELQKGGEVGIDSIYADKMSDLKYEKITKESRVRSNNKRIKKRDTIIKSLKDETPIPFTLKKAKKERDSLINLNITD